MADVPHFAYPFKLAGNAVAVVEQDSRMELMSCANYLAVCPTGFLHARPDFGWVFPEFRNIPLNPNGLVDAMERFCPTARFSAGEVGRVADMSIRTITLQLQQVPK